MRILRQIAFSILTVFMLTSCEFISNSFTYNDKTKEFVDNLLKENYDKCIDLLALDHEMANNTNIDTIKMGLANFRQVIIKNWGTDLNYTFVNAEKTLSTNTEENAPPNTTQVQVQFSNKKNFGVFKVLFDDKSKKILNINTLDIDEPIPSMTLYWLFGIIAICIPIFNIYVIIQIKRSDLKKKWLKYIAVIFLNVPALTYAAVNGFSFDILNFQFLIGISFSYMGYLNSAWTFGFPLGGLYWFWKLRRKSEMIVETESTIDNQVETIIEEEK
ncbi:MAG: hypothetical protein WC679_13640 [Bacteroidales bacterium]